MNRPHNPSRQNFIMFWMERVTRSLTISPTIIWLKKLELQIVQEVNNFQQSEVPLNHAKACSFLKQD